MIHADKPLPTVTDLKVFPNTGHHFFTVPLKQLLPDRGEAWLARFVEANRGPWRPWDPQIIPFVLYRYTHEHGEYLLKLVVETNLGLPSRGLLFDVEDSPEPLPMAQTEPPYVAADEAEIVQIYKTKRRLQLQYLPNVENKEVSLLIPPENDLCRLNIFWEQPGGHDPIDVDLIVDLGNTRTVALLLESPGQDKLSFGRRVRSVRFLPRNESFSLPGAISEDPTGQDKLAMIDSWLLLHRPAFSHLEPPFSTDKVFAMQSSIKDPKTGKSFFRKKNYLPQTFAELSPALIGGGHSPVGAAQVFANISLEEDARFYLSSPKRYVWDDEPLGFRGGTFWSQILDPADGVDHSLFGEFNGLIRVYMDPSGVDWNIDQPPSEDNFRGLPFTSAPASYPRRDAICWFALSILETAARQINSVQYRDSTGRRNLPRRLRYVRVTYPAGWTYEERSRYLYQWQRAINFFTLAHLADHRPYSRQHGGDRPVLAASPLDEAVASQLPILFSEVGTMSGDGAGYLQLMGRNGKVVVMNVDIGGGTTDLAIIAYQLGANKKAAAQDQKGDPHHVVFQPRLLFRDGNSIAGDMLVKRIIERVLLPAWARCADPAAYKAVPAIEEWLRNFFRAPEHQDFANVDPRASRKLMRIVRLAFIPLVNEWLRRLTQRDLNPETPWESLVVSDHVIASMVQDLNVLARKVIQMKVLHADRIDENWEPFPFADVGLQCDPKELEACIESVFGDLFQTLGRLAARFGCDLVVVSGKPSELPSMRRLMGRSFPLLRQRVLTVRNYPAGSWYPLASIGEGRIQDAKTCTVVGAALFQDICNQNLANFGLMDAPETFSKQCYWGVINAQTLPEDFHKKENLLFSPVDYKQAVEADGQLTIEKDFTLPLNCRIGRRILAIPGARPEPVYKLHWERRGDDLPPVMYVKARLRWVSRLGQGEKLELIGLSPAEGFPAINAQEVRLSLNTLFDETFWLDEPKFEVGRFTT